MTNEPDTSPPESPSARPRPLPRIYGRLNTSRAQAMLADWHESGLSREAFVEQAGLKLQTFDRWRCRLEGSSRQARSPDGGLASVEIIESSTSSARAMLEILPGPQPRVLLPITVDESVLRRVVRACSC